MQAFGLVGISGMYNTFMRQARNFPERIEAQTNERGAQRTLDANKKKSKILLSQIRQQFGKNAERLNATYT